METKHDYGCAMLYFDFDGMQSFHDILEIGDIYAKDGHGIETQPHVTLLYGFHNEVNPTDVLNLVQSYTFSHVKIHNVSLFENEEYDVLKFDAESEVLHNVNVELRKLPHTNLYSTYHPHMTIAYLKPGTGKKYLDKLNWVKVMITPKSIVYSKPTGEKIKLDIW